MTGKQQDTKIAKREWPSLTSLHHEMNRLFSDFWGDRPLAKHEMLFTPNVDLRESDKFIDVTAEVPGLAAKDIKVELSNDGSVLTMSGEKRQESEKREENLYYAERSYGSFRRTIPMPTKVNADSIEATCMNGVLKLHMAKVTNGPQKNIKIKDVPG